TLRIFSGEQEAFNFVGGVERITFVLVQVVGKRFQHATDIGRIRGTALVDDIAKHQDLSWTKNVRRSPVEGAPIDAQAQVAFSLRREPADGRTVEGHVVPVLDQEFLVVVEHVQATFEIAEQQRHRLNALYGEDGDRQREIQGAGSGSGLELL